MYYLNKSLTSNNNKNKEIGKNAIEVII